MTSICIWRGDGAGHASLWACADSQISDSNKTSSAMLVDVPKVFPLQIVVKDVRDAISVSTHTIGLAFSGSSLLAGATNGILANVLSNLLARSDKKASIDDVASIAAAILKHMGDTYHQLCERDNATEIAIFGFCPVEKRMRAFRLCLKWPWIDGTRSCVVNKVEEDVSKPDALFLMGSHIDEVRFEIEEERKRNILKRPAWVLAPVMALKKIIDEDAGRDIRAKKFSGIGGAVHYSVARETGFVTYLNVGNGPGQVLSVLGIDINMLGIPDGLILGIAGIDVNQFR